MNVTTHLPVWRDRFGNLHRLDRMDTPYLTNVVKCLWNNVIHPEKPFGDVIQWEFDSANYPADYLSETFAAGFAELSSRKPEGVAADFIQHVSASILDASGPQTKL